MRLDKPKNTIIRSKNDFKKMETIIDISSSTLFPELSENIQKKETNNLNFLEAVAIINDEKNVNEPREVKPGWVYLTKNVADNEIVWNPPSKEEDTNDCDFQKSFLQMTLNWEKYKQQYEEINGDGSYDRTYGVYAFEDYDEEFFDE